MNARWAFLGMLMAASQFTPLHAQQPASTQRSKANNEAGARPLAGRPAPERSASGAQTASPTAADPSAAAPGQTGPARVAKSTAVQPVPAGRMVTLDVLVADMSAPLSPPTAAAILELEKAGKLAGQTRVRLAGVENQTTRVQFGETVPRASGRTIRPDGGFRGAGSFNSYSDVQVGTIVQATSRVEADGAIVAELKIDRSNLAGAPRSTIPGEPNPDQPPQAVEQLSLQTTVRIKPGEAVIVGGRDSKSGDVASQTWIVLTAQVAGGNLPASPLGQLPVPAPAGVSELKVFTLKHAFASDLAPVLSNVFAGQPVRFSVDPRTNSLLVIGPASSLQSAQALVTRLDGD